MEKIKLQKIVDFAHILIILPSPREFFIYDKLRKLYMNGTVIMKVLAFLNLQKILGNVCFSEQIFHRKQSLGVPDFFYILNICLPNTFPDSPSKHENLYYYRSADL